MTRSNLHVVTAHDGRGWLDDSLIEGDFIPKVVELLDGDWDHSKTLIPGISQAFYRGDRAVLVMTFGPEVDRTKAEQLVADIGQNREDVN